MFGRSEGLQVAAADLTRCAHCRATRRLLKQDTGAFLLCRRPLRLPPQSIGSCLPHRARGFGYCPELPSARLGGKQERIHAKLEC